METEQDKIKIQNDSTSISVEGFEFSEMLTDCSEIILSKLKGIKVEHITYGVGTIEDIEQRFDYTSLVDIKFLISQNINTFDSDSFKSKLFKKVDILQDEYIEWKQEQALKQKQKNEKEQARIQKKEKEEEEEKEILKQKKIKKEKEEIEEERARNDMKERARLRSEEKEREELKKQKEREEEAIVNHRKNINSLGVNYLGTSFALKKRRTPNCYGCKAGLDNAVDLECNLCHWVICHCGACGCGWSG